MIHHARILAAGIHALADRHRAGASACSSIERYFALARRETNAAKSIRWNPSLYTVPHVFVRTTSRRS